MTVPGSTPPAASHKPAAPAAEKVTATAPEKPAAAPEKPTKAAPPPTSEPSAANAGDGTTRRAAKRRPAAPPRARIAANDDAPSIGGLIFALQQKPTNQPFMMAAAGSGGWLAVGSLLAWAMLSPEIARIGFFGALGSPTMIIVAATIFLPIALFWFLAMLAWRAQELKLMSAAMTEVAVRLAEPDRAAEQSAASLGQAVRRAVSEGLLLKGGGHAMAAGITLRKDALAAFRAFMEDALGNAVESARRDDALLIDGALAAAGARVRAH